MTMMAAAATETFTSPIGGTVPAGTAWLAGVRRGLVRPVDAASLVAFRVAFGLIVVWEVYRYFDHGWIAAYFAEPRLHFNYFGFEWVQPLPLWGMRLLFLVIGACGLAIALGAWYRVAAISFTVAFGYVFLLEAARWLNHFYLMILIGALLAVVPANAAPSIDAARSRRRARTVPAWALWLLRFQVAVVFVYGAIAKLNADWLSGEPMRMWLEGRDDVPVLGLVVDEPWAAMGTSIGALAFDLLILPAVLWRMTRLLGLVAAFAFHFFNRELFSIGVFPYLAMASTLLFCDPSWPRSIAARLRSRRIAAHLPRDANPGSAQAAPTRSRTGARVAVAVGVAFVVVQLLVPLRHFLYPGPSSWTEEGHRFAWHMMLREKQGVAVFTVHDPHTGQFWMVDPQQLLEPWQYNEMVIVPELVRQFSHFLADEYARHGYDDVEVFATVSASLNGRSWQPLIDPTVNLAAEPRRLTPAPWIAPLERP